MQKLQAEAVCADLSRWILIAWLGRSGTRFLILRADLRSDGRRLQGRMRWRKGCCGAQFEAGFGPGGSSRHA